MKCPYCLNDHPPGTEFCPETGHELPSEDFRAAKSGFDLETPMSGPFFEGDMIRGRYRVVRELGRGGMGVVYLVQDTKQKNTERALKVISPSLIDNEQAKKRFVDEAMSSMDMTHPNIVKVFHSDEDEGLSFYLMEYIAGKSLRQVMEERSQPFSLQEAVNVLVPVLDALHHAHTKPTPVIHRDISPENIMLKGDLSSPHVTVLDFGLAKLVSASKLSRSSRNVGKEFYICPEQLKKDGIVGPACDLFAVGVMLYELLTGTLPRGVFEMPTQICQDCPEAVDEFLRRALSNDPDRRFATALEMRETMVELSGKTPPPPPPPPPGTVEEWIGLIDQSIQERNWTESLRQIEEALRVYPNLSYLREKEKEVTEALREISSLRVEIKALKKNDHAIAIEKLTRLLDLVPTDVSVRGQLLEALEQAGRFEEALSLGKTFAKDNPAEFQETKDRLSRLVQAWERGCKELEAWQWGLAKTSFEEALALSPGNKAVRDRIKEAETSLKKIETLRTQAAEAFARKDMSQARNKLEELLKISPQDQEALERLEDVKEEEQRKKIEELKGQAEKYLQDGKFDTARKRLKEWLELSPGDGQAARLQEQVEQAEREKRFTDQKRAARVQEERGDFAEAQKGWQAFTDPLYAKEVEQEIQRLGRLTSSRKELDDLLGAKQWDQVLAKIEEMEKLSPSNPYLTEVKRSAWENIAIRRALFHGARVAFDRREYPEAKNAMVKILEIGPEDDTAREFLAKCEKALQEQLSFQKESATVKKDSSNILRVLVILAILGGVLGFVIMMQDQPIPPVSKPPSAIQPPSALHPPQQVAPAPRPTLPAGRQPGEIWKEPYTGMEFVWVPGGCFQMGCGSWTSECWDNEKPVHQVCLDGFWIGKYEVTQAQWQKVMGNNRSHFKGPNNPVENVSWHDAQEFIRKLNSQSSASGFRLPTEAQWEYACRGGGRQEKYCGGNNVDSVAWHRGNSGGKTHPVGGMSPNALGIYDMSGNVLEWVSDVWDEKAYSRSGRGKNPEVTGGGTGRVFRGGSWGSEPRLVRSADRGWSTPGHRAYRLGFRLALSPG